MIICLFFNFLFNKADKYGKSGTDFIKQRNIISNIFYLLEICVLSCLFIIAKATFSDSKVAIGPFFDGFFQLQGTQSFLICPGGEKRLKQKILCCFCVSAAGMRIYSGRNEHIDKSVRALNREALDIAAFERFRKVRNQMKKIKKSP